MDVDEVKRIAYELREHCGNAAAYLTQNSRAFGLKPDIVAMQGLILKLVEEVENND